MKAQYPPARAIVDKVQAHFARHAAFWASLRREEGFVPRISLAFLPPDPARSPMRFEQPLALGAMALARLAPAVERPGIHLGVWRDRGELCVWGMTRALPALCFVVEVAAPGLLVVKHRRRDVESGKFVNVAVLEGDQVKWIDERAAALPDCPALVTSLVGFDAASPDSVNVLAALAISMRQHRRGGSLLVVPSGRDGWRESISDPIPYRIAPAFLELAALMAEDARAHAEQSWQDALRRSVEAVAGLTAVDGATVMTDRYEVLAFGAKIRRREGEPRIEQVRVTEPVEGGSPSSAHPTQLGGTRHQSAAQFVQDQRAALALVASQDGRFTIFAWSPCDQVVYAYRAEALLL